MSISGSYIKALHTVITVMILLFCSLTLFGNTEDPQEKEAIAKQKLAEKLNKVSNSYSVKEARYSNGKDGNFDRNSGNPGDSNTTYHSYVWDYCLQLAGSGNCQKWLDPYVSKHGMEEENDGKSPLETQVAALWKGMKKPGDNGQGGSYGIWNVQAKGGGSILDDQGRLDRKQLTKFELKKDVTKSVEQIGYSTASKSISVTFDEDAPKNTMPNMESLRLMAGRWTRMFRNRMVTNLGELRANDVGTEIALGEDLKGCEEYLQALKVVPDEIEQERIKFQGRLDPETFSNDIKKRFEMCIKARNASVYMVNAKVNGDKVTQGNLNEEQVDKARSRANITAIDYGGIDVGKIPMPQDQKITEEEAKPELAEWNEGGTKMNVVRATNGEQIQSYNKQLQTAAQGMKEAAARSPFVADVSKEIAGNQIQEGEVSLVELNGLTKEMKNELKDTNAPSVKPIQAAQNPNPDRNYEDSPAQLTVTAAR